MVPYSAMPAFQDSYLPGGRVTPTSAYRSTSRKTWVLVRGLAGTVIIVVICLQLWPLGVSSPNVAHVFGSSASQATTLKVDKLTEYLAREITASLKSSTEHSLQAIMQEIVKTGLQKAIQDELQVSAQSSNDCEEELYTFKLSEAGMALSKAKLAGGDEASQERVEAFSTIYEKNIWSSSESRSGEGSELADSAEARKILDHFIEKLDIKSMVDAPCGDFNWQHHIRNFSNINYTGLDIVPQAILDNSLNHLGDLPNARFANVDLVTHADLPYADLYLVRDVVQHLSLKDAIKLYQNVIKSGAKYLLTTMHFHPKTGEPSENYDITPGNYALRNPLLPPFTLPEPLYYARDQTDERVATLPDNEGLKVLGLWKLDGTDLVGRGSGEGFVIDPNSKGIHGRVAE